MDIIIIRYIEWVSFRRLFMENMTIDEMNRMKDELGLTYKRISELSGVPLSTVQKVLGGITSSPRYTTIKALNDVLLNESRERNPFATYHYSDYRLGENVDRDRELLGLVMEASPYLTYGTSAVKHDGMMTIDDYNNLGDDRRVELIYGVFYDMATPSMEHQLIVHKIMTAFSNYIEKNKGNCVPMMAPLDVQIKSDKYNMVEPDVMIICNKDKLRKNKVVGAPDLVVEVVSKTSGSHDRIRKLNLYYESKVREYWIVDPLRKEILVYELIDGEYEQTNYSFEDMVPVGIYDGKLKVDFNDIKKYVDMILKQDEE